MTIKTIFICDKCKSEFDKDYCARFNISFSAHEEFLLTQNPIKTDFHLCFQCIGEFNLAINNFFKEC